MPNIEVDLKEIDQELIDYIKTLKFKHKIFGIDEKEIWTVVSNIQKFYSLKELKLEMKYKGILEEQEKEIERLKNSQSSNI